MSETTGAASAEPVANDPVPAEEPLGEGGLKALQAERDARAAAEKQAAALQAQIDEIEAAKLSDLEKAQKLAADAEARADALMAEVVARDRQILRQSIGAEAGLPAELIDRMQGDDEAALREDAKKLAALVPDNSPSPFPKADPSQGVQGTPSGGTTADRFASALTKAGF